MAKLVRPVLFSQAFDVPPDALRVAGLLDPVLNSDTKLFIDPLLLKYSRNSIIKANGLALLRERFDKIIRLITASKATSDAAWRAARRLMNLEERKETCLGYGGSGVSGRSRPDTIKDAILNTTKEVLDLGVDDPEIISLMGIFEEKVGPDTISDLTTNAIMPALARITETVCKEHNIQRAQFIIEGETLDLPVNPVGRSRHGIVLVPRDILRQLPIATDWSEISDVAYQNKLIRDRVNALIADLQRLLFLRESVQ